ncbi:hypothetical protein CmeUKMEL1_04070 [Cryptosporidium meleagridis]|uniref:Uncharacterized protein n=1 Tax=Cryptosporidium meleagridis TaxID=93969 RepID=A0A2P4YY78_9CRYT|nr:hypothetical protein CmeUKMEL1_04070 [Cryptosporidium meleagridis]
MEILTHDDTESIKFIHGPRFRLYNNNPPRILICNPLKYLILERELQIIIFDLNIVLSNPDGLVYFESNFDKLYQAQLGKYNIGHESTITHMVFDYSSTILTIVTERKILLFDLLNIDRKSEWMSINHDGIQSLTWTRNHDIITIETDMSCSIYHFIPSERNFHKTKLILDGISGGFKLVEAVKSSFYEIEFILITENEKNIVIVTNELYCQIISCKSKLFNIPESFVRVFSILIEPILGLFQEHNSEANLICQLHITSAKFIDGDDLYLSISLIRFSEYVDGYVLFFKIHDDMKMELSSYSINDLCFDNVDSNDINQIKKIRCVSLWVKEWGILFIGSNVFSQMVVFTCNHSYINKENSIDFMPHKWMRLAMCEGYDINCTNFDIGIFDSCLCTCNSGSIRDPKSTIDAPKIHQPPAIFIVETNGDIIIHYIGGNQKLIKPIKLEGIVSLITNSDLQNIDSNDQDFKTQSSSPKHLYNSINFPSTYSSISKIDDSKSLGAFEQIFTTPEQELSSQEICMINKSGKKLFDSIMKIDDQVSQLEKKCADINKKFFKILNSQEIQGLLNFHGTLDEIEPNFSESVDLYQLISRSNEISNVEIQLRRIHLYIMKKISDEVYKNTNIEMLKEKLRKNELTSSQISILFQYNTELFDAFTNNGFNDNQTILNSLITIERLSLKLASRISQVSMFCERLNSRRSCELEFTSLPPPEYSYNILNFNDQDFSTPIKIHVDSKLNAHLQKNISSVNISKKRNSVINPDSKGKHHSYSSKRSINLSEIINNISNSVIDDDLRKLSFTQNDESNIIKSQKLKINNLSNQTNTPGRYIQLRSKFCGYSCNEIQSDNLVIMNKSTLRKNIPFFVSSWIPGLAEDKTSQVQLTGNPNFKFGTKNKYIKPGIPNSTLANCIERLERIVDHCEIAKGSISFIEREELIPGLVNKKERDSARSIECSSNNLQNGSKIVASQLLLSRNSFLQKNMMYRQKLSLIISGFISKLSDKGKLSSFQKITNCSMINLKSNICSKFNNKDLIQDGYKEECTQPHPFMLTGKFQKSIHSDYEAPLLDQQSRIDANNPFGCIKNTLEKKALKDQDNALETASEINNFNFDNYSELKAPEKDIKINTNSCQEITKEPTELQPDSEESNFSNKLLSLNNNLDEKTSDSALNGKFTDIGFSDQKNEIEEDFFENGKLMDEEDIKSSLFSLSLINNDTPNSKKASEGLFTFSTEMNICLNLKNPISEKKYTQDIVSNESNIFSFSSDSNPLKPINNICSNTKKTSENNNLSYVHIESELNKFDDSTAPKVEESVIESNTSSNVGNSDPSCNIKDINDERVKQTPEGNSTSPTYLGGSLGFPNFLANLSAPKVSGFGSSQFLIDGPFSSNNSDNNLCNNSNNCKIEEQRSFGFHTTNLNLSTPFKTHPVSDNSMGGFATFSSEFRGFSQISEQNSTNSFSNNSSSNIFNFAPPQKPRQVNKLD